MLNNYVRSKIAFKVLCSLIIVFFLKYVFEQLRKIYFKIYLVSRKKYQTIKCSKLIKYAYTIRKLLNNN